MKKTLSINISGIIFHIEEDGYESLRKYLDSINKYFGSFDDSSEILADIESRIAEIFLAKLNEGKQVITAEDVQYLMATMGNVNDFKAAEENDFAGTSAQEKRQPSGTAQPANKKLVRDQRRKILGGVCAGLAHYFSIDPVWVRVVFGVLFFFYGSGILVYLILWIVLPGENNLEEEPSLKKMYRNPDKKVLGGVAGGVAAYFGGDVVLVRILFLLLLFAGGFGLLLYIILWFSLPEAKTITEKMEMQGEPVTLSNIESTVKKNLNEKDQDESTLAKIILFPFRAIAEIMRFFAKIIGPIVKGSLEVVRIFIGIIILMTGIALVISVLLAFGLLFGLISSASLPDSWGLAQLGGTNFPIDAIKATFPMWMLVAAFFVAFIPSLFIQMLGSSIIAKRMVVRPLVGWTMFVIFFISVLLVAISLPRLILSFKEEGEYRTEHLYDLHGKTAVFKINETGLDDYHVIDLHLKGYDGTQLKLTETFKAQGRSRKQANENAKTVTYQIQQADSILTFDSNIIFPAGTTFHAQRLEMELLIPYNQHFVIDGDMWRLIDNSYGRWNYAETEKNQTWIMTAKGLECLTCPPPSKSEQGLGEQDQFGLKDFNELDIKGVFNLTLHRGDAYSIEILGDSKEREKYKIEKTDNLLEIDYRSGKKPFWSNDVDGTDLTKVQITLPHLSKLKIKGAGKIKLEGFDEDDLSIALFGAMACEASLSSHNLQLDLSGPVVFELDGHGDFLEAEVSKVAQLKASSYEVRHAVVSAKELGRARVNATERVEIETDVTGSVKYQGNPEVIRKD
ncbi:MAG: PspC domain-containing protein [Bacteroidetes bacterium]|nr:PspC domain-containing protein [Bacteroidota bacterium]MBS1539215.1 PspC domain-containing protein [Bacteroidota bacterium]